MYSPSVIHSFFPAVLFFIFAADIFFYFLAIYKMINDQKFKVKSQQYNLELVSKELNHLAAILGVWFLWSKTKNIIIFQKERGNANAFTLLILFIVKSLKKEQNSTNLLLWPPICRNKHAITPKWFNSLDTNSN